MNREPGWVEHLTLVVAETNPRPRRRDRVSLRWERKADPEGIMTLAARRKKADRLMKNHMKMMRAAQHRSGRV